ncbi:MAG: hypothetical protein WBC21_01250 [Minisyncoccales bacterium]
MPNIEDLKQAQQQLNPHTKRGQIAESDSVGEASPRSGVGVKESEQDPKDTKNFPRRTSPPFTVSRAVSEVPDVSLNKKEIQGQEEKSWVSPQEWQKEILNEKQKLEKASKEIENWQAKIQERLGIIKKLESQSEKIDEAVGELQQKIVLVKKENNTFLYQIRTSRFAREP